jgi:hypothetical protein
VGLGTAAPKLVQGQSIPALDRSAAEFTVGGTPSRSFFWHLCHTRRDGQILDHTPQH